LNDLLITGATVVREGRSEVLDVAVTDGVIADLGTVGTLGAAFKVIDAEGMHVLPGAVDVHFHCRAPSHPERGTFGTETRAAAAGGVTTVLEMPISDPPCTTPEVFEARRRLGEAECHVDFGLFSGAALSSAAAAEEMAEHGAVGFKLFTHLPPPDRIQEFVGLWASTPDGIRAAFEIVGPTGLPCTVHAEDQRLLDMYEVDRQSYSSKAQPTAIESSAVELVGSIALETGAHVHIAHMTSADAVDALDGARRRGANITAETCPHYLLFNEQQIELHGPFVRVSPPLRTPRDNKVLWEAVSSGLIDVVASDHAPFTPEEKRVPYEVAPRGIPGIELMVPGILDATTRGQLTIERATMALAERPASIFGLSPRKGRIEPGADADLVIWDSREVTKVSLESLLTRSGGSAAVYDGLELRGRIKRTILRGMTVFEDGAVKGEPGGRFVRPLRDGHL
jgi:allantoinase